MRALMAGLEIFHRVQVRWPTLGTERRLRQWARQRDDVLMLGATGYHLPVADLLDLRGVQAETLRSAALAHGAVLAEIDQDGLLLSHIGALAGVPMVDEAAFLPRGHQRLRIVNHHGTAGVRKEYDRLPSMLREIETLHGLAPAALPIPAILDLDIPGRAVTISFLPGHVLREELARRGARLRDRDWALPADASHEARREARRARIADGRRVARELLDERCIEDLFAVVRAAHRRRFVLHDLKFGNLIIERGSGRLDLIDFDAARHHRHLPWLAIRLMADWDVRMLDEHFGTDHATYRSLRRMFDAARHHPSTGPRPSAYAGAGLAIGPCGERDHGHGLWTGPLLRDLPDVTGMRVLDLEAGIGGVALQLCRAGAREVVGIEADPGWRRQAELVHLAVEWYDARSHAYRSLDPLEARRDAGTLGSFDLAIALDHRRDPDRRALRDALPWLAGIAHRLAVCEVAGPDGDAGTPPSSLEVAMRDRGYEHVRRTLDRGGRHVLLLAERAGVAP